MNEPKTGSVDPQTLLSLYGMYSGAAGGVLGGGTTFTPTSTTPSTLISPSTTPSPYSSSSPAPYTSNSSSSLLHNTSTTLGLAASQAQALGIMSASNTWWNMASQLAAQEYLSRLTSGSTGGSQEQAAATEYLTRLAAASASAAAATKDNIPSSILTNTAASDNSMADYMSLMQAAMSRDQSVATAMSLDQGLAAGLTSDPSLAAALSRDPSLAATLMNNPSMAAALQAQSLIPGLEMHLAGSDKSYNNKSGRKSVIERKSNNSNSTSIRHSSPVSFEKHLRLPSDTQILKAPMGGGGGVGGMRDGAHSPVITLPTGLTIEKKKPGRKVFDTSFTSSSPRGDLVDRVEITRIQGAGNHQNGVDLSSSRLGLDLSAAKNGLDFSSGGGLDMSREERGGNRRSQHSNGEIPLNLSTKISLSTNKSQEFDGGLSLAEQIRQQELASQLHKHLQQPGSLSAMQALLSLGRIHNQSQNHKGDKIDFGHLDGKDGMASILAATTARAEQEAVAGLLASARGAMAGSRSDTYIPELTIRPVYRKSTSDKDNESSTHPSDDESNHAEGGKGRNFGGGGRQIVTDPEELKIPLQYGWRRETTIREFSKSGVRGDVVYVAPCGKKFKQYPDIIRYVEKHGMNQIKRTHFSFSTKLMVGDFLKPTGTIDNEGIEKYERFSGEEMNDELDKVRKEHGWKPRRRGKGVVRKSVEETIKDDEETRIKIEKEQVLLQKEAIRIIREAEKREKTDQLKKEKEKQIEDKKRKQEEQIRAKQEDKLKRMRDIELKKQQAVIMKEQDKERRREHMVIIRQLENKKRNEERKKKFEDFKVQKEKERELRMEAKRIETEISHELKRPIEDMAITVDRCLPEIQRVEGLQLSGTEFANLLMVFEFIHNFGETLNFDMEAIPTLDIFQSAIMNHDTEAEDELIGILTHLLAVAVLDPGVPNPLNQLTILGQNLRQVEVTPGNISEVLRIFLSARAQHELKLFHNLSLPEPKDKKEATQGPFVNADTEYLAVLADNTTWQMAEWIKDKPFLSLNPFQKTEILAFLCNELLNNKAVVNQIENTVENIQVVKRKKLSTDSKVKKLKILHNRKYKFKAELGKLEENTNTSTMSVDDKDDSMSTMSDSTTNTPTTTGRANNKTKKKGRGGRKKEVVEVESEVDGDGGEEEAEDTDLEDAKDEEEESEMSAEDLQRKIERVARLARKREEELNFVNNSLRATDLGQDRYRRRYWSFAHAGGIWVEGIESADLNQFKIESVNGTSEEGVKVETKDGIKCEKVDEGPPHKKLKLEDLSVVNGVENKENLKDFIVKKDEKTKKEKMPIPTSELLRNLELRPKVTTSGERMNLFNHTAYFNMTLSQSVINGSLSSQNTDNQTFGIAGVSKDCGVSELQDKPWINLVASTQDIMSLVNGSSVSADYHPGRPQDPADKLPHLATLEAQLEEVKLKNTCPNTRTIPGSACRGWWKLDDQEDVNQVEANLLDRGIREQNLHTNIKRGFEIIQESTHKLSSKQLELTAVSESAVWPTSNASPSTTPSSGRTPPCTWSRQVALRVEKMILEQIEGLEDKVASASMQMPGWKVPDRLLSDTLKLRPSCEHNSDDKDSQNVVEVCRQRLLELEAAVERRYLKAPLGNRNIASLQSIAALTEKSKLDDSLDEKMEEGEENKENQDDNNDTADISHDNKENLDNKSTPTNTTANTTGTTTGNDDTEDSKKTGGECSSVSRGLLAWRTAVQAANNTSQIALAYQQLENSIAWDKSIMKARCQFCHGEQDEDALLLCDSCDKAFHMYCFKPELTSVPDGEWFCWECVNKATGLRHCLVCGDDKEENIILCSTCPRAYHNTCITPAMAKVPRGKWSCPGCSQKTPRRTTKASRSSRPPPPPTPPQPEEEVEPEEPVSEEPVAPVEEAVPEPEPVPEVKPTTRKKSSRTSKVQVDKTEQLDKDLGICVTLITELAGHDESWPFINPVNTKQFPTYKKIIKHPMDITTVRRKLNDAVYKSREEFQADVNLMFTNCKRFNEDDSPVGRAGHLINLFFQSRWIELTTNTDVS